MDSFSNKQRERLGVKSLPPDPQSVQKGGPCSAHIPCANAGQALRMYIQLHISTYIGTRYIHITCANDGPVPVRIWTYVCTYHVDCKKGPPGGPFLSDWGGDEAKICTGNFFVEPSLYSLLLTKKGTPGGSFLTINVYTHIYAHIIYIHNLCKCRASACARSWLILFSNHCRMCSLTIERVLLVHVT